MATGYIRRPDHNKARRESVMRYKNYENVILLDVEPPIKRVIGATLPKKPVRAAREFVSFLREHAAELTQM